MPDTTPAYTRLATARFGLAGMGSLWLGPDHLLQVSNSFGVEHYRRWFFKDIQTLVARRTARRLIWNLIVGGGGVFVAAAAATSFAKALTFSNYNDAMPFFVIAGIGAVVALAFFGVTVANTLLGPGCVTHVQTPLGVDKLNLPSRLKKFNEISARLAPLIEAAQRKPE